MDEWLPVFMEKMGCPAARADMISASSPPFSLSRVVSTASASCIKKSVMAKELTTSHCECMCLDLLW